MHREVVGQGHGRPGAAEIAGAPWIRVAPPAGATESPPATGGPADRPRDDRTGLGAGEAEAIALAAAQRLLLIIDDRRGREAAVSRGEDVTGSGGVLLAARRRGLVAAVRPLLDELVAAGLRLDEELYTGILARAGE